MRKIRIPIIDRSHYLHGLTAVVVTFTRSDLQHDPIRKISTFLLYVMAHYLGVLAFSAIAGAIIHVYAPVFLGDDPKDEVTLKQVMVVLPATLLLLCVALLIVKYLGGGGDDYWYE
jgi:hypothetical protein